jgi:hypothetical protein
MSAGQVTCGFFCVLPKIFLISPPIHGIFFSEPDDTGKQQDLNFATYFRFRSFSAGYFSGLQNSQDQNDESQEGTYFEEDTIGGGAVGMPVGRGIPAGRICGGKGQTDGAGGFGGKRKVRHPYGCEYGNYYLREKQP